MLKIFLFAEIVVFYECVVCVHSMVIVRYNTHTYIHARTNTCSLELKGWFRKELCQRNEVLVLLKIHFFFGVY